MPAKMPSHEVPSQPSESAEDFLKALYSLQLKAGAMTSTDGARVATNALAQALEVSPSSITDMARRMVEAGMVDYQRYYGMRLTETGYAVALRVIRRHRLIELYLVEQLEYSLHEVHDEAENLEHVVSDRFVEAIARKLGEPTVDPHGDPIPMADGTILHREDMPLSELEIGQQAHVSRYAATDDAMLNYILEHEFTLGAPVELVARDPFEGPLTTRVNGVQQTISHLVGQCIMVTVASA